MCTPAASAVRRLSSSVQVCGQTGKAGSRKPRAGPNGRQSIGRRGGRPVRKVAAWLGRRPEGRRWAGLWDFPRFPISGQMPGEVRREVVQNVRDLTGVHVAPGRHVHTLTHSVRDSASR